ncbi:MAG: hypothetical protein AB7O97_20365 [Planctomycetota bacterium]
MKTLTTLVALCLSTAVGLAQTCTFTSFGRPCGGDLAGQQVRTPAGQTIRFDVTNAAPGAIAVMVIGGQQRGVQLPGSNCLLLVNPRGTQLAQVDRGGDVAFRFPIPARLPVQADFQVVTIGLSRSGRIAESTNGVNLVCR